MTDIEDPSIFWQPRRCKSCEYFRLKNSLWLQGRKSFSRKENLFVHNSSSKCPSTVRSQRGLKLYWEWLGSIK